MNFNISSLYGFAQFPDKELYKAATLLDSKERPNVPVSVIDNDPSKNYIFKVRPKTGAISDDHDIKVVRQSQEYKAAQEGDYYPLASVLAHEQQHRVTGPDEHLAYQKAYDFLKRVGYKNTGYLKQVQANAKAGTK